MDEREKRAKRRRDLKRVQTDSARDMRLVKQFDSAFMAEGSEIQLVDGGIIADRDEHGVYAELIFKNLSAKQLARLKVRFDFYYYQNIPYRSLFFEYCEDDITFGRIKRGEQEIKQRESLERKYIKSGEVFGEGVYIPMPESPYTKLAFYICEIEFTQGELIKGEISLCGRGISFQELDEVSKRILKNEKQFKSNEYVFPTKNLPQFSNEGWLCCCGHKNYAHSEHCERCLRGRDLQQKLLSEEALKERKNELASQPTAVLFHDKSRFAQNKYLQNERDRKQREAEIKRSRENLARQEEEKRRKTSHWLKRTAVLVLVGYIIFAGTIALAMFRDAGRDNSESSKMFKRILDGDTSLFEYFGFKNEDDGPSSIFDVWDIFQMFDYE